MHLEIYAILKAFIWLLKSSSSSSSLVDQGAVDCRSSPTGSVLGSAHVVIL